MAAKQDGENLLVAKNLMEQQINVARSELKNIRQEVRSLSYVHQKEMEKLQEMLLSPELLAGAGATTPTVSSASTSGSPSASTSSAIEKRDTVSIPVIGTVTSWFGEKRGTPRQPGVCKESQARLTLSKGVFTNPEHTLEGLASFSHMWLIFYFHKNNTTRIQAKVSPPRLNGERVGVFGTRSPHRPAPIGLSLVKIEKVEGATVFFSGVDMVDGTPVLDIKPYIPHYDSPWCMGEAEEDEEDHSPIEGGPQREAATGSSSDEEQQLVTHLAALNASSSAASPCTPSRATSSVREAPDGEEGGAPSTLTPSSTCRVSPSTSLATGEVRVPSWIEQPPVARLTVRFSERAVLQLVEVAPENTKEMVSAVSSVLREDPRSVYLRERWSSHFFTFLIKDLHISCKFDDKAKSVTVFQVRSAKKCAVCGEMEWQCTNNGACQSNVKD